MTAVSGLASVSYTHLDVLRGDLTAGAELLQHLVVRDEAALAVGDGHGVELVGDVYKRQP